MDIFIYIYFIFYNYFQQTFCLNNQFFSQNWVGLRKKIKIKITFILNIMFDIYQWILLNINKKIIQKIFNILSQIKNTTSNV